MIEEDKVIVMDIDGTLCPTKKPEQTYSELIPFESVISKLRQYHNNGYRIILHSSRQMRTHQGNIGRINATTAKVLFEWLDRHEIPYDEIHLGKPWCGRSGFYVDDKTIRPREFLELSEEQITQTLTQDKLDN